MMQSEPVSVWLVVREYAGIAEAGGVKNVTCSLAEALSRAGKQVAVFMPRYGCVREEGSPVFSCDIDVAGVVYRTGFREFNLRGVRILLVDADVYRSKHSVYVYTEEEARLTPGATRGKGYFDVDVMNLLLQKAVLNFALLSGSVPDILHCQDAHAALLPALIRTDSRYSGLFENTGITVTIHNAGPGYRQILPDSDYSVHLTGIPEVYLRRAVFNSHIEPFLLASAFSTLSTVSPWYADELTSHRYSRFTDGLSAEFERRHVQVFGITNGIDYGRYVPSDTATSLLPYAFDPEIGDLAGKYLCRKAFFALLAGGIHSPGIHCSGTLEYDPHAVYFGYHGRIAAQKGIDVLARTAEIVLGRMDEARFIVLGQGDLALENTLEEIAQQHPGRFIYLRGYERILARLVVAVSDFLVLPSIFEPCGLEDFIAQIFGTIPVAHAVGGLQKIEHERTGFLYHSSRDTPDEAILAQTLCALAGPVVAGEGEGCASIPEYVQVITAAAKMVHGRYNWDRIVRDDYLPFYRRIRSGEA